MEWIRRLLGRPTRFKPGLNKHFTKAFGQPMKRRWPWFWLWEVDKVRVAEIEKAFSRLSMTREEAKEYAVYDEVPVFQPYPDKS